MRTTEAAKASISGEEYHLRRRRFWKIILLLLSFLFVITVLATVNVGSYEIGPLRVAAIILAKVPVLNSIVGSARLTEIEEIIILQIRVPRVLAAAVVGMALASAGVIFQGIFRNPMADPYVIGVSSGATVGAALAIVLGLGIWPLGVTALPLLAFVGAYSTVLTVYALGRVGPRIPITTLLLSGIAVNILLSAVLSFLLFISGEELRGIIFWLLGGFSRADWSGLEAATLLIAVGIVPMYVLARDLNVILVGEETAKTVGVDTEKSKKIALLFASLATAAAVSISGIIGFVGLVIPHVTRMIVGPDHRVLIPASLLSGAIFLMLCDALSKVVLRPVELPVGIITALVGGPFFLYLLRTQKGSYEFR